MIWFDLQMKSCIQNTLTMDCIYLYVSIFFIILTDNKYMTKQTNKGEEKSTLTIKS